MVAGSSHNRPPQTKQNCSNATPHYKKSSFIMDRQKWLEWTGVGTAILYSMLIALNIGAEFIGFLLLFLSAGLIGLWAYFGKHRGIMLLQLFYATAGLIGMFRWF
jgi:hypothetical protein